MKANAVVLVTGASSGIGKEIAKQLKTDGYVVYGAARRLEHMDDLKHLGVIPLKMDITVEEDIVRVNDAIGKAHGGVDILINNAGFGSYGAMEDTPIDDARYQFEVNLFGLARMTQAVLPHMREQKAGRIVNISSMCGKAWTPLGCWYNATKFALEGWSDCLRLELSPFGIDVIIIQPGAIRTEFDSVLESPLLERSGSSAYADLARRVHEATPWFFKEGKSTRVTLISKTVSKALKAKRPKTRYAAGRLAKPSIFATKWLSDRIYDKIVMSRV